jgi:hypothetical protein
MVLPRAPRLRFNQNRSALVKNQESRKPRDRRTPAAPSPPEGTTTTINRLSRPRNSAAGKTRVDGTRRSWNPDLNITAQSRAAPGCYFRIADREFPCCHPETHRGACHRARIYATRWRRSLKVGVCRNVVFVGRGTAGTSICPCDKLWDAVDAAASGAQVVAGRDQLRERSNGEPTNGAVAYGESVWT